MVQKYRIAFLLSMLSITFTQLYAVAQKQSMLKTTIRNSVCLNGIWDFKPLKNNHSDIGTGWGKIAVPGVWYQDAWWTTAPGIIETGKGENWNLKMADISMALYKRSFLIPVEWKKKEIVLQFDRISTDAEVFIDSIKAGEIHWPGGELIISKFIKFGKKQNLSMKVIASASKEGLFELMGTANAQVNVKQAKLSSKGITGEVYIKTRQAKACISDVFVQTSVRKKEISATIEFSGIQKAENLTINAILYNAIGVLEKTFKAIIKVESLNCQVKTLTWKWDNPQLWDLDQPNIYTLRLSVNATGVNDEYIQEFGFREFWAEGKDFYLNNKKINLRPISNTPGGGNYVLTDAAINGLRLAGYNFIEIWPQDISRRGMLQYNDIFMQRADKFGILLSAPLPPSTPYIMDKNWQFQWNKIENKIEWEKKMLTELRRVRNHPSVVMWGINPNFFGHSDDQNPLVIGQRGWIKEDIGWQTNEQAAIETVETIKKHDPTRLVFNHHGAYTGDVSTLNFYLCLSPLQERLDWLSHYAAVGNMPFMAIEFGTPLENTMLRGRCPFGESITTEPLFTEYAATYFGTNAYLTETDKYKEEIKRNFLGNQQYKWWQHNEVTNTLPSFQQLQALFNRETWSAWRTWGISGGMVPWSDAHGWRRKPEAEENVEMPTLQDGQGGTYYKSVSKGDLNYFKPEYWDILPSAKSLIQNNNETLAWIAGAPEKFTEKSHNFFTNQLQTKQIILINDSREVKSYYYSAKVMINNKLITETVDSGNITVAEILKSKLNFTCPTNQLAEKVHGEIQLNARIGNQAHTDTFSFSVFKPETIQNQILVCFDPLQKTTNMLRKLGYRTSEWKGESCPFLVVGREALSGSFALPADLKKYIENGGKALIMTQQPEWFESEGFRVAKHLSRYVFAVNTKHPVLKDIDDQDMCNWNGSSTLTDAFPDYLNRTKKEGMYGIPYYGWHWGNHGALTSVALEKPHKSGWTPILQCEFDLAYSPLMELNLGKGLIVQNTLDLEDYVGKEPVADKITKQIIEYIINKPIQNAVENVVYIGNENGKKLLESLGLSFVKNMSIAKDDKLIIIGNENNLTETVLYQFLNRGGKLLFLYQSGISSFSNILFNKSNKFPGSLNIPNWDETRGLSVSDMHWRSFSKVNLLKSGCDIGMNGLFGRKIIGKGTAYFCQINPDHFNADSLTYFRFTRWRQTRALCQILANIGVRFEADKAFLNFKASSEILNLEGEWKAKLIDKMPVTLSVVGGNEDKGISPKASKLIQYNANEDGMETFRVPMAMERYGNEWSNANGEVVFRKAIEIPDSFINNDLELFLGVIDDFDQTYFNGTLIGKTDETYDEYWGYERKYLIPASLLKKGKNVIAIRVFDRFGKGGMLGSERIMSLKVHEKTTNNWYHSDYRSDFKLGDDPFRYFRW
jgi:beta-galactosidase